MMSADAASQEVEPVTLNKRQLAAAMGASVNTIDRWLDQGMPFVAGGSNGRAYAFDPTACRAWREEQLARLEAQQRAEEAAVRQMRLALDPVAERAPEQLTPQQQREQYEAAHRYHLAARQRRELVEVQPMVEALEEVFAAIRDAFDSQPDMWARELGLNGQQVEKLVAINDQVLDKARRAVLALIDGGDDAEP